MQSEKIEYKTSRIETPLGLMLAIGDDEHLYLLEFVNRQGLERNIERFRKKMHAHFLEGRSEPLKQIEDELKLYFAGKKMHFETPIQTGGSPFQEVVWQQLREIPSGETRSYRDVAESLGRPTAYRAVAQANATNQLALIIPCHRVKNANGNLGGYAGGVDKKAWLLNHEALNSG